MVTKAMNLCQLVTHTIENVSDAELALGYLRYEQVRRLNARQFTELSRSNLKGEGRFDDLVDSLIISHHSTQGVDHK